MKIGIFSFYLFILTGFLGLAACQGTAVDLEVSTEPPAPSSTATTTPNPTFTPTPTTTATATLTPTPTTTPTPTLWVLESTPLASAFAPITAANAGDVSAIAEWQGNPVVDLEWIPGTLDLAVASPNSIELYDLVTRTPFRRLYPQAGEIVDIAFSPDRSWFVSGSRRLGIEGGYTSNLEIWSGPDLKPQGLLNLVSGGLVSFAFTPDSSTLIDAFTEPEPEQLGLLESRRIPGWAIIRRIKTGTVLALAVSTDSTRLATSPDLYHLQLWDLGTGKLSFEIPTSFTGAVSCLAFSPDRKTLASGHYDGTIRLWDVNTGSLILKIASVGIINTLDFTPDGSLLATGSAGTEAVIRLWSTNTGELLRELPGHPSAITRLLFTGDSQLLVSGSFDGTVRIWGVWP